MTTHHVLVSACVGISLIAQLTGAQRSPVPLRGVVYDSLSGRPLRDAFVTVAGAGGASTTDARGRFQLDAVEPGLHTITAHHALLDSIGLSGLTTRAMIANDGREVRLAIPSFETLWRVGCGGRVPKDSGLVFGTIRRARGRATVSGALIELSWWDLMLDKSRRVVERRWSVQTRSDAQGGYAVCGVSNSAELSIQVTSDSVSSGVISLPLSAVRVQRRDLSIGSPDDSAHLGAIAGVVTDPDGHGLAGARIITDGAEEVRSGPEGQFVVSGVWAGTRRVEVLFIGVAPAVASADVTPGDTAMIAIRVSRAVALAAVRTTATYGVRVLAPEFNERRKHGFGYTRDSIDFRRYDQFANVLHDIPGLNVRNRGTSLSVTVSDGKGGFCVPDVMIDAAPAAFGHLLDLLPSEVGGLEVYTRAGHIPPRFVPTGIQPLCGMILVWTKYGFRNR